MGASSFEYRFRYAIHGLIYALGFFAPWNYWLHLDHGKTVWEWASIVLFQQGWLRFETASVVLLSFAIVFAALGAFLRTWGTAYLSSVVVQSSGMHGNAIVADGPYRYLRNPLYLGTILHTLGLALIMPPSGALFTNLLITLYQFRLILAEEPFLTRKLGEPYLACRTRVSRLLPSLTPRVAASGAEPHWLQAILGEIYFIGVATSFAALGWHYNAFLLTKCVVIALGVSLLARATVSSKTGEA